MATFRKRGKTWRAELWVGDKRHSASFATKREAQLWAEQEQTQLRQAAGNDIPDRPFRDLLERYGREVVVTKRGARREQNMINVILRDPVADVMLPKLAARDIAAWRDRRSAQVSGSSVDREMTILSHACSVARREWGWLRTNPVSDVRRPAVNPARTRRPTPEETAALLHTLGYAEGQPPATQNARVGAAYLFAIETAMRAGEICGLTWPHVHARHVHLPQTKNGFPRDVPLSKAAQTLIEQLRPVTGNAATVFEVRAGLLDALFRKAKARALIEDLHFHDTRREALTRLSKVFDVMALARISGHRDLRILQNVYYRPSIDDLADQMD